MGLREKVKAVPFWYHRIELPDGIVTPGVLPVYPEKYKFPLDLTGKRVLDVGAWDGFWTFKALQHGAREVVAIDDFSDRLGCLDGRTEWDGFDLCKEALGYSDNMCDRVTMSVYDVTEAALGRFDVVLCYGVLYHLRHPLLALEKLAAVCDGDLLIESAIIDDFSPHRREGYAGQHVAEFFPRDEYASNQSNWWVPTLTTLAELAGSVGFREVEAWKLEDEPRDIARCRGFLRASQVRRKPNVKAIMSVPRLGFLDNIWCGVEAFAAQGIPMDRFNGAYWEQQLSDGLEKVIASDFDLVFVFDYDTIFTADDVNTMIRIMTERPEIDALAGAQTKRETNEMMFGVVDSDGNALLEASAADFAGEITRVGSAHFGLTCIRVASLKRMSTPWLMSQPNDDGEWHDERIDADIYFWKKWREEGFSLYQANAVRLGHLELMICWPADPTFRPVFQHVNSYSTKGRPAEVMP